MDIEEHEVNNLVDKIDQALLNIYQGDKSEINILITVEALLSYTVARSKLCQYYAVFKDLKKIIGYRVFELAGYNSLEATLIGTLYINKSYGTSTLKKIEIKDYWKPLPPEVDLSKIVIPESAEGIEWKPATTKNKLEYNSLYYTPITKEDYYLNKQSGQNFNLIFSDFIFDKSYNDMFEKAGIVPLKHLTFEEYIIEYESSSNGKPSREVLHKLIFFDYYFPFSDLVERFPDLADIEYAKIISYFLNIENPETTRKKFQGVKNNYTTSKSEVRTKKHADKFVKIASEKEMYFNKDAFINGVKDIKKFTDSIGGFNKKPK